MNADGKSDGRVVPLNPANRGGTEPPAESAEERPRGGMGALYPISRGALQAAELQDLMTGEIIATQGREHVREAVQEFADGHLGSTRLLELLCCEGCIMGAGMSNDQSLFSRRSHVRKYAGRRMEELDRGSWESDVRSARTLCLHREFTASDQRISDPADDEVQHILVQLGKVSANLQMIAEQADRCKKVVAGLLTLHGKIRWLAMRSTWRE